MTEKKAPAPHVYREDPNEDKEDTRPVEIKKKPTISIDWAKLKRWLEEDEK